MPSTPRTAFIPVNNGELYYREVGTGRPIIVLHGGPEFDHTYLLPDLDRLADSYRLIYYDQRGRGKSEGSAQTVSLQSEMDDLDALRQHLQLDSVDILGHSWGGVLAMAYALDYPARVSHLILLNSAPACHADMVLTLAERRGRMAALQPQLSALTSSEAFAEGDLAMAGAYFGLVLSTGFKQREHHERLDMRLSNFTIQGVIRAREIEQRLNQETYARTDFSLFSRLSGLKTPTLIIHGDYDFVPPETAANIARAIPGSRLRVLPECGHFAYIEAPEAVRAALTEFFADNPPVT